MVKKRAEIRTNNGFSDPSSRMSKRPRADESERVDTGGGFVELSPENIDGSNVPASDEWGQFEQLMNNASALMAY
eukprot:1924766-Rhodomonas_salina.1